MNKRLKLLLIVPFVVLFSFALFKRNIPSDYNPEFNTPNAPIVLATSLADTLGQTTFQKLHIRDVEGIKVKYPSGNYASYFEYEAERNTVLHVISNQPFARYAQLADTRARKISADELKLVQSTVTGLEFESTSFWSVNPDEYEVYECLKSPMKHTVLVNKKSNKILHRIEYKA